ncbi:MAG: polysaccharide deacetylase family protein [Oscillospiraceae bacterium]|nr:polysaccharide deacetylase family protein [Oscillospiraceae bacterium]
MSNRADWAYGASGAGEVGETGGAGEVDWVGRAGEAGGVIKTNRSNTVFNRKIYNIRIHGCIRAQIICAVIVCALLLCSCGTGTSPGATFSDMKIGRDSEGAGGSGAGGGGAGEGMGAVIALGETEGDRGSVSESNEAGKNGENADGSGADAGVQSDRDADVGDDSDREDDGDGNGGDGDGDSDSNGDGDGDGDANVNDDGEGDANGNVANIENSTGADSTDTARLADNAAEYQFSPTELDAMDDSSVGWGVKLDGHQRPAVPSATLAMFEKYNTAYIGADEPVLFLTFDLGYENGNTAPILDVLAEKGATASFFITGHYLATEPDIVRRIYDSGHMVANHSLRHTSFPDGTDEEVIADITGLASAYTDATGNELSMFLRPPSGEYSERSLALAATLGYRTVMWSFAFVDYDEKQTYTTDYAFRRITDNLHNGAVILLHTVHKENALVLGRVIDRARNEGYTFSTLDKL